MPEIMNFSFTRQEDGILSICIQPPAPIGGLDIRWKMTKRFGSEDNIILKSVSSGYNGASGITVTNSGNGTFNVVIWSNDTSGLEALNYATEGDVTSSGRYKQLTRGYMILQI